MKHWRNMTAVTLVVCLFHLSFSASLMATTTTSPILIKQQADQFGIGANVRLKLVGGEKLRGSIQAIEDGTFLLAPDPDKQPRRIGWEQVSELRLAKRVYRASGEPNPIEAKRVVLALGVGKHVAVKTAGGKKLHGHIQAIEADHFTLLPDNQPAPVQIAYNHATYIEKNLSMGATIVLVVLIAAAVVVTATVLATR